MERLCAHHCLRHRNIFHRVYEVLSIDIRKAPAGLRSMLAPSFSTWRT